MSSLAERLNEARKPVKPKFETWIDTLDETDREALLAAAVDKSLTNVAIMEAVKAGPSGYSATKDTISKWRKSLGYAG